MSTLNISTHVPSWVAQKLTLLHVLKQEIFILVVYSNCMTLIIKWLIKRCIIKLLSWCHVTTCFYHDQLVWQVIWKLKKQNLHFFRERYQSPCTIPVWDSHEYSTTYISVSTCEIMAWHFKKCAFPNKSSKLVYRNLCC